MARMLPRQLRGGGQAGATSIAALLLAFLAGLLGGALAGRFAAPRAAPGHAPGDPALDRAVERALITLDESTQRLGSQLELLGRELSRAPSAPEQLAPAVGALPPDLALLIASVEQLSQAVRAQASQAGWGGRSPAIAAPMLSLPPTEPPPALLAEVSAAETEAMRRRHLFWSYQQILDSYGRPLSITVGDGHVTWEYQSADGNYVGFRFFDGMVMDLWN
jgi:hypothetical protein